MLILISGQPGNGKTLRALALMREEYERNLQAVNEGKEKPRRFFTNIVGVKLPWAEPIPEHRDWRLLPDGSFVIYDEAHSDGQTEGLEHYGLLFPSTGKPGESNDERVRAMSTHRHRGFDIVFVTQWPSKIHHNIRQLVGKHIHMNRALGLQRSGMLTWSRVQSDPYDERERDKAEEEIWPFPKDLFDQYQSATLHTATYKFKVPAKVWGMLSTVIVLALVMWALWAFFFSSEARGVQKAEATSPGAVLAPAAAAAGGRPGGRESFESPEAFAMHYKPRIDAIPWSAPAFDERKVKAHPQLFCMIIGEYPNSDCKCMTEQGTVYDLDVAQCHNVARRGPVYDPFKEPVRGDDRGREAVAIEAPQPVQHQAIGVGDPSNLQQAYGGFRSP